MEEKAERMQKPKEGTEEGREEQISEAANAEIPSAVTNCLFISGALAASSTYTLQRLGITHIVCLCTNQIGQLDSQFPDIFTYKNFDVFDNEDFNISSIFEEACDFIDCVEKASQSVLVHCFEGKSRSVTLVLAYLMLRKKLTLLEAWNTLKRVHPRSQPNHGFAKILVELDQKLHGKVSMELQQRKQRRPMMKICSICGKNVGLSSSSLKLHLRKSHAELS